MKQFKHYLQKQRKTLSWESGFAENRNELTEEVASRTNVDSWPTREESPTKKTVQNSQRIDYDESVHGHEDVKPKNMTPEHREAAYRYSGVKSSGYNGHASSKNINGYLRNRMGEKTAKVEHHKPEEVEKSVKALSSAFTPENTNRKKVVTYSGVPAHIGEKLEASKKGDAHHLAGFTSTSTSPEVAYGFARQHNRKDPNKVRHIVKFHVHPGAGLSLAHESSYAENELLLHHGAKTSYSHTEINTGRESDDPKSPVVETHIHHVYVHPEHIPLSEYGSYDHPKRTKTN